MADDNSSSSKAAAERVAQVSRHMAGSASSSSSQPAGQDETGNKPTKRRTRSKSKLDGPELPADHSDILGQLDTLRKIAATPDPTHRGYARQKQSGKLWVRERVDLLLDQGSFVEIGSVSGDVEWEQTGPVSERPVKFTPSNNVQGMSGLRRLTNIEKSRQSIVLTDESSWP